MVACWDRGSWRALGPLLNERTMKYTWLYYIIHYHETVWFSRLLEHFNMMATRCGRFCSCSRWRTLLRIRQGVCARRKMTPISSDQRSTAHKDYLLSLVFFFQTKRVTTPPSYGSLSLGVHRPDFEQATFIFLRMTSCLSFWLLDHIALTLK